MDLGTLGCTPNPLRSEVMEETNTFFICLPEPLVKMKWKDYLAKGNIRILCFSAQPLSQGLSLLLPLKECHGLFHT